MGATNCERRGSGRSGRCAACCQEDRHGWPRLTGLVAAGSLFGRTPVLSYPTSSVVSSGIAECPFRAARHLSPCGSPRFFPPQGRPQHHPSPSRPPPLTPIASSSSSLRANCRVAVGVLCAGFASGRADGRIHALVGENGRRSVDILDVFLFLSVVSCV